MKYLFILFSCFFSVAAFSQTDSTAIDSSKLYYKNVVLQARDIEALSPLLLSDETYEEFYMAAKTKFNVANVPANNATVTIDSVRMDALIGVYRYTCNLQYAIASTFVDRIQKAMKAYNNTYLQRQLAGIDAEFTERVARTRQDGRRRLKPNKNQ